MSLEEQVQVWLNKYEAFMTKHHLQDNKEAIDLKTKALSLFDDGTNIDPHKKNMDLKVRYSLILKPNHNHTMIYSVFTYYFFTHSIS